jgi:hypothetical protein
MRYRLINELVWKWRLELEKIEWREQKPKTSRNCNGCSALRHLMGNSFRSRLPRLRPLVQAEPGEIESSEHFLATRWGKAHMRRQLTSVQDQAWCWIWMYIVLPNQQSFMCNAESVEAYEKKCSKRIMLSAVTMRNCVVVALIQVRDGLGTRLDGKSRHQQKYDPMKI